jgi:CheY-like chemotaxis protein
MVTARPKQKVESQCIRFAESARRETFCVSDDLSRSASKMPRIALAEDNPSDVVLIRRAIQQHFDEFEFQVFKDGQEAIEGLASVSDTSECPDVLLLDINLPKYDGLEVLEEIRKHPQCSDIPVVITSSVDMHLRPDLGRLRVDYFFQKPNGLDEFMTLGAIVRTIIERKSTAA